MTPLLLNLPHTLLSNFHKRDAVLFERNDDVITQNDPMDFSLRQDGHMGNFSTDNDSTENVLKQNEAIDNLGCRTSV